MDILKSKIDLISQNLPKLTRFLPKTFDEFQKDDLSRGASERYFQLVVDAIIDCNQILIEMHNLELGDTYLKTFSNLIGKSIFSDDLLKKLANCVSTRNAIVHKYDNIQLRREFDDMCFFLPLIAEYLKIISDKYL